MHFRNIADEVIVAGCAVAASADMGLFCNEDIRAFLTGRNSRHQAANAAAHDKQICLIDLGKHAHFPPPFWVAST